jgi:hypothetical protein
VSFYSQLSPPVSKPLTNRAVLLSTLLQDILHPSHHLLNVSLQIANKLGLSTKKKILWINLRRVFTNMHIIIMKGSYILILIRNKIE